MSKDYIDKLAWIRIEDRKVLATQTKGKNTWYIPGGKREAGESDEEALVREVKEELTVDLVAETIKYYNTFEAQAHGKPEGTMVRMTCYFADYEGIIAPSSEIDAIDWHASDTTAKLAPVDIIIYDDLVRHDLID